MTKASRDASVSVEAKHTARPVTKDWWDIKRSEAILFHMHGAVGGMVHTVSLMR